MSKDTPKPVDIVQQINGNFGRWQLRTILLIFLCKIPTAWFTACVIYTAPAPQKGELVCRPTLNATSQTEAAAALWSTTHEERQTDRTFSVGVCNAYAQELAEHFAASMSEGPNATTAQMLAGKFACEHVAQSAAYSSLVTQFDLICSRRVLVAVTQSFHALGALIGGLAAFQALRHISPRRLMLIGMLGQIFCGNLTGLVNTYPLHIYFRCLTSVFCALMYTSGQFILSDITAGKARTLVITLSELFWSIGLILLPAISIYFDSWSYLYVAISSSLIVLVFLHRWIANAPRWLLRHNKIEAALQLLLESATYNNRNVPLTLETQLQEYAKALANEHPTSYCTIWDGETSQRQLAYVHWIWASAMVLYNLTLLMIRSLGAAQVHVNTACLGFAEMLGLFLGLYFILYTRRLWRWTGNVMIIAGLGTYFVWLLPETERDTRRVGLELIFWMLLKFGNATSIAVLTTCTSEMVSVRKRVLLMLSVTTFSRIGLIFGPLLSTLTVVHRLVPISILATLGWTYGIFLRQLNRHYWNTKHLPIGQVLTPNTYRRNSAVILRRRSSTASSDISGFSNDIPAFYENSLAISISDLWHPSIDTINECQNGTELDEFSQKT